MNKTQGSFSIGLVVHEETRDVVNACLSSLDKALHHAGVSAELVCVYTEFSIKKFSTVNLTPKFFESFSGFSNIVLIPLLESQNVLSFKRNLILHTAENKFLYFTDPDVEHSEKMFKEFIRELVALEDERCFGLTGPFKQQSESSYVDLQIRALNALTRFFGMSYQGTDLRNSFVDHAPCAHLLLDKDKVRKIGGFSVLLGNVGEDLDLSHRITNSGGHYYFTNASSKHSFPGFFKCYLKFFNYGQAQVFVQMKNGADFIRWYRMLPLAMMTALFMLSVLVPAQIQIYFVGATVLFSTTVLGAYYFGMVSGVLRIFSRRPYQSLRSQDVTAR